MEEEEDEEGREEEEVMDLEERVRKSLFGQLKEQMSGWEDRAWRRGFVHMQDAARVVDVQALRDGLLGSLVAGLAAPCQVVQEDHRIGLL